MSPGRRNTPQDFWAKVEIKRPDECWPWLGFVINSGYGSFDYAGKKWPAHRLAFVLTTGQAVEGLDVCHQCDNRLCCNPSHLFDGTRAENLQDMRDKNRGVIPIGTHNGKAKLNPDTVRLIRQLSAEGISGKAIARQLNFDSTTIRYVLIGKTWKHVK